MKVLLHICCAVCASSCVERLRQEGNEVAGFFYNPNIHPPGEYLKRLEQAQEWARQEQLPLIAGDYNVEEWSRWVRGLEEEPEGGRRCAKCFQLRLETAAKTAKDKGFDSFSTTLTVSPQKNAQMINEIGSKIDNGLFLVRDFKKQDGFKRVQELSKQFNLYHQDYCGCIFSYERRKNDRIHKKTCPGRHKS